MREQPMTRESSPVHDAAARSQVASILAQVREGKIGLSELMNRWPKSTKDPALRQIYVHVLSRLAKPMTVRSGGRESKLAFPREGEQACLLERAVLFLGTDLPYLWPPKQGLPALLTLTGLIAAVVIVGLSVAAGIRSLPEKGFVAFVRWSSGGVFLGLLLAIGLHRLSVRQLARPGRRWKQFGSESHWPFASAAELDAARARATAGAGEERIP